MTGGTLLNRTSELVNVSRDFCDSWENLTNPFKIGKSSFSLIICICSNE